MKKVPSRCGSLSKSTACVLIAVGYCLSIANSPGLPAGTVVDGNLDVGISAAKGGIKVMGETGNTALPGLQITGDGGVVFVGTEGVGKIPATGAGVRLMWFPKLGAFRAGGVPGTEWDEANTGYYSNAFGYGNLASGSGAFAAGNYNVASGVAAVAMGSGVTANSTASAVFGAFNIVPSASATAWVDSDPLFTIGNGLASNQRSTAMKVQKDGIVNIYSFGATNPSIVLNPTGTPKITISGQKVVTADANGYVGINATPTNSLSIGTRNPTVSTDRKAIEINAGGYGAPAAYNTASNGDKLILFRDAAANYDATIGVGSSADMWFKSSGTSGNGMFRWYTGSSVTNSMVLDGSGRLGIGTSTPNTPLHVSSAGSSKLRLSGGSTQNGMSFDPVGTSNEFYLYSGNAFGSGGFGVYNMTTGSQALTILNNGNVGIGATNSSLHLMVGAGTGAETIGINGGTGTGEGAGLTILQGTVTIGSLGNTARLVGGGTSQAFRMQAQNSNNLELYTIMSNPILFGTGSAERMRIDASGNVGIGSTSPTAKLEVAGSAKFSGTVTMPKQGDIPMGQFGSNGD
jgi:hypothetical protein